MNRQKVGVGLVMASYGYFICVVIIIVFFGYKLETHNYIMLGPGIVLATVGLIMEKSKKV